MHACYLIKLVLRKMSIIKCSVVMTGCSCQ